MNEYEFTLTLESPAGLEDGDRFLDLAEILYGAFEGDVEVEMSRGVLLVQVTRAAPSMADAIRFALTAVRALGLRVKRLGPESLVSAAQIASRLHISRERVSQLLKAGALPPPVAALEDRSPLYRWPDVVERLLESERVPAEELEAARSLERANAALTIYAEDTDRVLDAIAA